MIIGIGTDLFKISHIEQFIGNTDDPFIRKTYTKKELQLLQTRSNPTASFAARFAGKEAVFKALSVSANLLKQWQDIEILEDENGQPQVILHQEMKEAARQKKITRVLISLSSDDEYALAYATAVADV